MTTRQSNKVKIVLTGPESTGKSTLSLLLSQHFNCPHVTEYAREYINELGRPYNYDDLLSIAEEQHVREQAALKQASNLFICDTSLLTIKIWSEDKFGKCHQWIDQKQAKDDVALYLLCDIDIPWVSDPQREDSGRREYLKNVYLQNLRSLSVPFQLISGNSTDRLTLAIHAIDQLTA